ncbi:hypothetical protein TCAP_05626, partial [Tolypocladium capitatum]
WTNKTHVWISQSVPWLFNSRFVIPSSHPRPRRRQRRVHGTHLAHLAQGQRARWPGGLPLDVAGRHLPRRRDQPARRRGAQPRLRVAAPARAAAAGPLGPRGRDGSQALRPLPLEREPAARRAGGARHAGRRGRGRRRGGGSRARGRRELRRQGQGHPRAGRGHGAAQHHGRPPRRATRRRDGLPGPGRPQHARGQHGAQRAALALPSRQHRHARVGRPRPGPLLGRAPRRRRRLLPARPPRLRPRPGRRLPLDALAARQPAPLRRPLPRGDGRGAVLGRRRLPHRPRQHARLLRRRGAARGRPGAGPHLGEGLRRRGEGVVVGQGGRRDGGEEVARRRRAEEGRESV